MQNKVFTPKIPEHNPPVNNHFDIRVTGMRPANNGKVRAYADVEIRLGNGAGVLTIFGFSVIHENTKEAWVGFPQRKGDSQWFPIVKAEGKLRELTCNAVLDAYKEAGE